MLTPNPEFDKPGYCALCHECIAEFNGANVIVRLLGSSRTIQVRLDDKSLMNVNVCEKCKDSMTPEETEPLMESVIKGWSYECDTLIERGAVRIDGRIWDESLKTDHMDKYGTRYIVERTDDTKWNQETIVEAVYAEAIAEGDKKAEELGIKWQQ